MMLLACPKTLRLTTTLLLLLLLLLVSPASAHAELISSEPADRTVIATAPAEAILQFSEPVEVGFSTFKIYRLEAEPPGGEPGERDWQRLSGSAGALVAEVISRGDDGDARVDTGVTSEERRLEQIVIGLEDELAPGAYVLMWRALSIDTHIVEGFVTFVVAPEQ